MSKLIYKILVIILSLTILLYVFYIFKGKDNLSGKAKRVVIITIDTLRADHLKSYGYLRERAPFLTELANKGTFFLNAFSQSSHTAPSHTSMFTGLYPFQHGVLRNHEVLSSDIPSITSVLNNHNIKTAAFTSVRFLDGKVGFPPSPVQMKIVERGEGGGGNRWYLNSAEVVDNALSWLKGMPPEDFLIWLHFYDVHQWMGWGNLPEEYRKAAEEEDVDDLLEFIQKEHGISLDYWKTKEKMQRAIIGYDARLNFVNDQIKRLYQEMDKLGFNDDSVWIITSDHGEGLGNHNYEGHGEFLYQEQIHIPLIIHSPSGITPSTGAVEDIVQSVDIFPTILDLFNVTGVKALQNSKKIEGSSLLPFIYDDATYTSHTPYSFAQRRPKDMQSFRRTWTPGEAYSVHDKFSKLIDYTESDDYFFDLEKDPKELNNIINSPLMEDYRKTLKDILNRQTGAKDGGEPELSEDEIQELRSLGYL